MAWAHQLPASAYLYQSRCTYTINVCWAALAAQAGAVLAAERLRSFGLAERRSLHLSCGVAVVAAVAACCST